MKLSNCCADLDCLSKTLLFRSSHSSQETRSTMESKSLRSDFRSFFRADAHQSAKLKELLHGVRLCQARGRSTPNQISLAKGQLTRRAVFRWGEKVGEKVTLVTVANYITFRLFVVNIVLP